MPKTTVTSIRVDEDLWREAKIHAIREGVSLGELLERLLRRELIQTGKRR